MIFTAPIQIGTQLAMQRAVQLAGSIATIALAAEWRQWAAAEMQDLEAQGISAPAGNGATGAAAAGERSKQALYNALTELQIMLDGVVKLSNNVRLRVGLPQPRSTSDAIAQAPSLIAAMSSGEAGFLVAAYQRAAALKRVSQEMPELTRREMQLADELTELQPSIMQRALITIGDAGTATGGAITRGISAVGSTIGSAAAAGAQAAVASATRSPIGFIAIAGGAALLLILLLGRRR